MKLEFDVNELFKRIPEVGWDKAEWNNLPSLYEPRAIELAIIKKRWGRYPLKFLVLFLG